MKTSKTFKTVQVKLPARWASFLINGDLSGLDESAAEIRALIALHGIELSDNCVDVSLYSELEEFNGLLDEVAFYTFLRKVTVTQTDTYEIVALDVLGDEEGFYVNDSFKTGKIQDNGKRADSSEIADKVQIQ